MIELELGEAVAVDWTESDYSGDRQAITRSALLKVRKDPRAFHSTWILGQPSDDKPNREMRMGTLTHLALLEPDELIRRVGVPKVPKPSLARSGARAGSHERKLYEQWLAACEQREQLMATIPDRVDLSMEELAKVHALSQSVWSHREASVLLSVPGKNEQTVIWREPETGLLTKVRCDRLIQLGEGDVYGTDLEAGPAVVDVKTTRDHSPRAFGRSMLDYGYLEQAAMYSDAVSALLGEPVAFYFVAIRSESNFGTAVYRPTEQHIARGREKYLARLREVIERTETNDWLADHERGVQAPDVPNWS